MFRRTDCHFAVGPEQYDQARPPWRGVGPSEPQALADAPMDHGCASLPPQWHCCRPPAASTADTDGWVCAHRGQEADQYLPEKTALINAEGGTVHLAAGP